jgi:putative transposase
MSMARPLRPEVSDGIYHVYNRGNAKQPIFEDDEDRTCFLRTFRAVRKLCDWRCLSYCLLGNHYHLLIRTPVPNLARGMRQLNSTYAQAFNRRRDRAGHVFQGRYGARLVERDEHFLSTLRYIALNPVEAGLCDRPEQWPWSAHGALRGLAGSDMVDVDEALGLLGSSPSEARAIYLGATADSAIRESPEARGEIVVGSPEFAAAAIDNVSSVSREMPLRQRLAGRPGLDMLLREGDEGLLAAYYDYGYSQREIADGLGCHYSTVCRRLGRDRKSGMRQRKT